MGYLLDGIQNDDPQLQAAIARVYDDTGPLPGPGLPPGKREDFELCAAYLLPKDPVVKRRSKAEKRLAAEISAAVTKPSQQPTKVGKGGFGKGKKAGTGATGVHLRYHTPEKYTKLTRDQRTELSKWRSSTVSKGNGVRDRRDATIAAAVAKGVNEAMATMTPNTWRPPSDDEEGGTSKAAIKAFIMSAFEEDKKKPSAKKKVTTIASTEIPSQVVVPPVQPKVTLASILKQAKKQA